MAMYPISLSSYIVESIFRVIIDLFHFILFLSYQPRLISGNLKKNLVTCTFFISVLDKFTRSGKAHVFLGSLNSRTFIIVTELCKSIQFNIDIFYYSDSKFRGRI